MERQEGASRRGWRQEVASTSAPVFRARERLAEIERSDLAARLAYHRAAVRRLSAACCIPL